MSLCVGLNSGHPLKKLLFPVERPSEHIAVGQELFILFLQILFLFYKKYHYFLTEKKRGKKDFVAVPMAIIFCRQLDSKQI